LALTGFSLSKVKNEDEWETVSYHPKECVQPSQENNFGGISRMLSVIKREA
jgi:hypothetical protein